MHPGGGHAKRSCRGAAAAPDRRRASKPFPPLHGTIAAPAPAQNPSALQHCCPGPQPAQSAGQAPTKRQTGRLSMLSLRQPHISDGSGGRHISGQGRGGLAVVGAQDAGVDSQSCAQSCGGSPSAMLPEGSRPVHACGVLQEAPQALAGEGRRQPLQHSEGREVSAEQPWDEQRLPSPAASPAGNAALLTCAAGAAEQQLLCPSAIQGAAPTGCAGRSVGARSQCGQFDDAADAAGRAACGGSLAVDREADGVEPVTAAQMMPLDQEDSLEALQSEESPRHGGYDDHRALYLQLVHGVHVCSRKCPYLIASAFIAVHASSARFAAHTSDAAARVLATYQTRPK